ncbi:DUF2326 domain-containing protein [Geodermatophilus sp. URMC 60]
MKLSRLYSNRPDAFKALTFNDGFSVVLAEIRLPENRNLDTHNLGKSTVGELIDFCLLKGKSSSFFLFKHPTKFSAFTFYLELQLLDGSFLTIARPVTPGSRIDLKRSDDSIPDASVLQIDDWDHTNLPFDRARLLVDGLLGLEALKPWGFRKLVGYLIRSQADYMDVFQLGKFSGKHQDWKPFVAHLLGLDAGNVTALYEKREEVAAATSRLNSLVQEWGADEVDPSILDGLIAVKRRDIEAISETLESFNFGETDWRVTTVVVEEVEAAIAGLNEQRYRATQLLQRLLESLEDEKVIFRTEEAQALFREAGVVFDGQLRRDYDQLIAFNRAITQERREALQEQVRETRTEIALIEARLVELNRERAESLAFLRESESLDKFKQLSHDFSILQADLSTLEAKRSAASRLVELRRRVRTLSEEFGHLQSTVEAEIEQISGDEKSRFGSLRRFFTEIVYDVLGQNAILAVRLNSHGGVDFTAEFVGDSGIATSGDRGTSYKKLLCIAFDLAMLRSHLDVPFAKFVYHDGALEQLEPRKRQNLIEVFRQYAELGLQPVISALDSDLPEQVGRSVQAIAEYEVVVTLHDQGDAGRLFMMAPW